MVYSEGVTVFIMSLNRPAMLDEALRSLRKQTLQPRKIVILDNGSSMENLPQILALQDDLTAVVTADTTHTAHWNFERARELADRVYRTKYVYIMHDDDRLLPSFLDEMIRAMDAHPECAAATSNGFTIDWSGKRLGIMGQGDDHEDVLFTSPQEVAMIYCRGDFLPFPFFVYRNGMIQKVFQDTDLELLGDVSFVCLIAQFGPIIKKPSRLYEYRIHQFQESKLISDEMRKRRDDFLVDLSCSDNAMRRNLRIAMRVRDAKDITYSIKKRIVGGELSSGFQLMLSSYRSGNLRIADIVFLILDKAGSR